jgi:hypothetical protein
MRLDRLNPEWLKLAVAGLTENAQAQPGKTAWIAIPTSPADKVQVGLKLNEIGYIVYLRRPGGKEDPREMQALLNALSLGPATKIVEAKGRMPRKWGARRYLVAVVLEKKAA